MSTKVPLRLPDSGAASYYGCSMPVNRFTVGLMFVLIALPLLLAAAWLRHHGQPSKALLLPTVSALLLLLAAVRDLKVLLLGPDYT